MCMEDVKIGRETYPDEHVIATAAAAVQAVKPNGARFGLLVQNVGAQSITLSLSKDNASGAGIVLAVGSAPLLLSLRSYGALVTRGWFAQSAGGASSLYVAESFLARE